MELAWKWQMAELRVSGFRLALANQQMPASLVSLDNSSLASTNPSASSFLDWTASRTWQGGPATPILPDDAAVSLAIAIARQGVAAPAVTHPCLPGNLASTFLIDFWMASISIPLLWGGGVGCLIPDRFPSNKSQPAADRRHRAVKPREPRELPLRRVSTISNTRARAR